MNFRVNFVSHPEALWTVALTREASSSGRLFRLSGCPRNRHYRRTSDPRPASSLRLGSVHRWHPFWGTTGYCGRPGKESAEGRSDVHRVHGFEDRRPHGWQPCRSQEKLSSSMSSCALARSPQNHVVDRHVTAWRWLGSQRRCALRQYEETHRDPNVACLKSSRQSLREMLIWLPRRSGPAPSSMC